MAVIGRISRPRRRALTFVECILAITILPLAVAGVALAVVAGQQQALEAVRQRRATELAEALMEEILSKPYEDPQGATALGPDAGETSRAQYDNMDDYLAAGGGNGFSESAGNVRGADGTLCPASYQGFSRVVTGSSTTLSVASLGVSRPALQITVTVSDAGGAVVSLTRVAMEPL